LSERPIPSNKYVLGKGELEILRILNTNSSTKEEVLNVLLSKRILNSKAACEKAILSLKQKNLIELDNEKVDLTEAGKLQRDVLIKTGIVTEPAGEKDGKQSE
jgi:hypothetical protein